jgi:hypothetical protein
MRFAMKRQRQERFLNHPAQRRRLAQTARSVVGKLANEIQTHGRNLMKCGQRGNRDMQKRTAIVLALPAFNCAKKN